MLRTYKYLAVNTYVVCKSSVRYQIYLGTTLHIPSRRSLLRSHATWSWCALLNSVCGHLPELNRFTNQPIVRRISVFYDAVGDIN